MLDFLNVAYVKDHLIPYEIKSVNGIDFHIRKEISEGFIKKNIQFSDKGKDYNFTERVKYIDLKTFKSYFEKAGLKIKHTFGDYTLSNFNVYDSERLILVATI